MNGPPFALPTLLAQTVHVVEHVDAARPAVDFHSIGIGAFVLTIIGAVLGTILVITRWGIQHAARERELEHKERLRAIESGFLLPKDRPMWTPVRVALAIGAGVPLGAFLAAAIAARASDAAEVAFGTACGVSLTALVCGTILAHRLRGEDFQPRGSLNGKPRLDEAEREMAEYGS